MQNVLIQTQDDNFFEEVNDICSMFNFTLQRSCHFSFTLKEINNYSLVLLDLSGESHAIDYSNILKHNVYVIEKPTDKNHFKFLLVDLLKRYNIIEDNSNLSVLKENILTFLNNEKINTKSIGFTFLVDLIVLCYKDNSYLKSLNELAYEKLAVLHEVNAKAIERDIRTTLNLAVGEESQIKQTVKRAIEFLNRINE